MRRAVQTPPTASPRSALSPLPPRARKTPTESRLDAGGTIPAMANRAVRTARRTADPNPWNIILSRVAGNGPWYPETDAVDDRSGRKTCARPGTSVQGRAGTMALRIAAWGVCPALNRIRCRTSSSASRGCFPDVRRSPRCPENGASSRAARGCFPDVLRRASDWAEDPESALSRLGSPLTVCFRACTVWPRCPAPGRLSRRAAGVVSDSRGVPRNPVRRHG